MKHRLMFVVEGEELERTRERDIPEFSGPPALAEVGDTILLENAAEGGKPVHTIVTSREFSYFQDLVSVLFRVRLTS